MEIICKNTKSKKEYDFGTSLHEILKDQKIKNKYPIVGALVDNQIQELSYRIYKPHTVKFFDITQRDGMRMYFRSLYFVLMKAVKSVYKDVDVMIEHSVSNGYFCQLSSIDLTGQTEQVNIIKNKMIEIINSDLPFVRKEILNTEAINIFEKNNYPEKARLFKQSTSLYTSVYKLGNLTDYFYGYLVPSTAYISKFDLIQLYDGMLLKVPKRKNPKKIKPFIKQEKMFDILAEHKNWVDIMKTPNVGRLNEQILNGNDGELIKLSEALHEKKIVEIVEIIKNKRDIKLILIAGPSSSGKTTFSKRLSIQLKVAGLKPIQISLDNYFVNREKTPKDENGEYNFEALEALDIKTFNKNINDLKSGKTIDLPKFSFETGKRYYDGTKLSADNETIFIAEGIHALNPELTQNIDNKIKYKIYISALTQIGIDGHNRIPTTDNRLIRRIIRDNKYRGYSAFETLKRWESVRQGEELNIFPYQEEADIMFNSALLYELAVLKKYAIPLLKEINQQEQEYAEAKRLLKFFSYFKDINIEDEIPPTSILREFFGESTFRY